MYEEARALLESGDLEEFREFTTKSSDFAFQHVYRVDDDVINYPILLVQTYRRIYPPGGASNYQKPERPPPSHDEFKKTFRYLIKKGSLVNFKDLGGRTVAHWTVLLQTKELLQIALGLECDPFIQDIEGQTIVHLAVRVGCTESLEIIRSAVKDLTLFETVSQCSGATPLIYAVQIGSMDVVKKLVQIGVNLNRAEENKYRRTALHYALFNNQEAIFEHLLKSGADVAVPDYRNKTVLHRLNDASNENFLKLIVKYTPANVLSQKLSSLHNPLIVACCNDDADTVERLVKEDESEELINQMDEDNRTALHHCAENSETTCAKVLLGVNPNLVSTRDQSRCTPLHLATIKKNLKFMELLLNSKANVNEQDDEGHSPLHWAVNTVNYEAVDLLLRWNADCNIRDAFGATPLHYVTKSLTEDTSETVRAEGGRILERLIEHGGRLNDIDKEGRSPFLWACSLNALQCCQILLSKGAKVDEKDKEGLSALHYAANPGNLVMTQFLLETGHHPIDCLDNNGCSPLFYAVTWNHESIVKLLLARGANVNLQDKKGRSVAHLVAIKGFESFIDILRENETNFWLRNHAGDLPLHEACRANHVGVVQKFLDSSMSMESPRAFLDHLNNQGLAPLHLAALQGSLEICQLLVENGATREIISRSLEEDKAGKKPWQLAANPQCKTYLHCTDGLSDGGTNLEEENHFHKSGALDDDNDSIDRLRPPSAVNSDNESIGGAIQQNDIEELVKNIESAALEEADTKSSAFFQEKVQESSIEKVQITEKAQSKVSIRQRSKENIENSTDLSPQRMSRMEHDVEVDNETRPALCDEDNIIQTNKHTERSHSRFSNEKEVKTTYERTTSRGSVKVPTEVDHRDNPDDVKTTYERTTSRGSVKLPTEVDHRDNPEDVKTTYERTTSRGSVKLPTEIDHRDNPEDVQTPVNFIEKMSVEEQKGKEPKKSEVSRTSTRQSNFPTENHHHGEEPHTLENTVRRLSTDGFRRNSILSPLALGPIGSLQSVRETIRSQKETRKQSDPEVLQNPRVSRQSICSLPDIKRSQATSKTHSIRASLQSLQNNEASEHAYSSQMSHYTRDGFGSRGSERPFSNPIQETSPNPVSPSFEHQASQVNSHNSQTSSPNTPRKTGREHVNNDGSKGKVKSISKNDISERVKSSVKVYESARQKNLEFVRLQRQRIYEGNPSDKFRMNLLKSESLKLYYPLGTENENYYDSSRQSNGSLSSARHHFSNGGSDRGPIQGYNSEDDELRRRVQETSELFQRVNRIAAETLTTVRDVNITLENELRNKKVVLKERQKLDRKIFRPKTSVLSEVKPVPTRVNKGPITASLSETLRQERLKRAYSTSSFSGSSKSQYKSSTKGRSSSPGNSSSPSASYSSHPVNMSMP